MDPCRCILFVPAVHSYPLPPLATESCRLLPPPSAYRQFKTIKAQKTVKAPSVLAVCADTTLDLDGKLRFSPHTSPCTDLFLHACCTLTCARSSTYTISHSLLPELTCTTWRWMLFDPLIDLAVASLYSDLAIAIAGQSPYTAYMLQHACNYFLFTTTYHHALDFIPASERNFKFQGLNSQKQVLQN